jgi:Domain of unknown function (DUF6484)
MERDGAIVISSSPRSRSIRKKPRVKTGGVTVGVLVGMDQAGIPHVEYPSHSRLPMAARSIVFLLAEHIGREVVLAFEDDDPQRPIIMGVVQAHRTPESGAARPAAKIDGQTVTLTADKEIVLQCGKASITLTNEGKIQIRGTYVLSRSSGVNRVQGGSIELN